MAIIKLEKSILQDLGYTVTECLSSIDAYQIFKANPEAFDLVLTDMTMPNMTGDELAPEMISIRSDIPIIFSAGFSEKMSKEKATLFGVNALLEKPVIKSDLAEMVRKVLDEAKE